MKCVKDRLFKRIWTVLLALMITVSFTPAVIFSESGADGAGQPAQTEQAGVKDGGGSTEKETAVEVASKDGDTDSEKGKKDDKAELSEKKEDNKEEAKKEENTETEKTGTTGETVAPETEVFEVTFECADPAGNAAAVTVGAFTIEKGGKIPSVPDAKDYAGYEFRGWQKDGSAGSVSDAEIALSEVTDNVTYSAVYQETAAGNDNNDNTENENNINEVSKGAADQTSGTAGSSAASGNGSAALKSGSPGPGILVRQLAAQTPQVSLPGPATGKPDRDRVDCGMDESTEETVVYTVINYYQDVDGTYYFHSEETRTGKVDGYTAPDTEKDHYTLNKEKTEKAKIAADGNTVVNAYYDLEVQTIRFWVKNPETNKWDKEYRTLTGFYGSEIDSWPFEYHWYGGDENGPNSSRTTFLAAFNLNKSSEHYDNTSVPGNTVYNFYGKEPVANVKTVMHYKQKPDGSWPGLDEEPAITTDASSSSFRLSDKFAGFSVYEYSIDGGKNYKSASPGDSISYSDTLIIRHKRNQYDLTLKNVKGADPESEQKVVQVIFENNIRNSIADITDSITENAAEYVPEGIKPDAEFAGWYTEKNCAAGTELKEGKKMPVHPLTLFAGWNYRWTVRCVDEAGNELMQPIENRECVRSNTPVMAEAPKISGYKAESESQEVNKNNQTITFKYKRKPGIVSSALLTAPRSYNGRPQAIQTVTDLQTDRGEVLEYAYYRIVNGNRIKADSLKDAGTYEIEVSILRYGKKIWRKTFKDIVVNVRSVTLTSVSRDMLYDGSLLEGSAADVQIGGDGFADGEGVVLKMTGSQRASGKCRNSFTYTARKGTSLENYEITARYGTLTVNPRTGDDRIDVRIPFDMSHFSLDTETGNLEGLDGYEFDFNGNTFKLSGLSAEIGDEIDRTKHIYELKFVGKPVVHDINKIDVTAQFKFNLKGQFIRLNEAFGGNPDDIRHGAPSGLAGTQAFEHVSGSGFNPYPDYGIIGVAGGGNGIGTGMVIRTLVNGERIGTGARVNHQGTDLISRMFDDGNASWYKKNMDRIQRDLRSKRAEIGKKAKKEKKGLPLLWWLFHKEPFGGVIGNKYQVKLFGIIPISDTAADVACVLGVMIAALAAMLYILKKAEKLRAEMTVELEDGGKIPAADSQVLRW